MIAEFSLHDVPPYYGLFIVGVLLLIWAMSKRQKRRKTKPAESVMNVRNPAASDLRAMADELNRLFADLQETARRLAAQVQNRATKLELLIAEADEKIKRLEALSANGQETQPTPTNNPPARTSTPPPPTDVGDPRHQRIYDLADSGKNPREIAQEVGAPLGEVELILNLRGNAMRT